MMMMMIDSLAILNSFEFFLFHFACYITRETVQSPPSSFNQSLLSGSNEDTINVLYYILLENYLEFFVPIIDHSNVMKSAAISTSPASSNNNNMMMMTNWESFHMQQQQQEQVTIDPIGSIMNNTPPRTPAMTKLEIQTSINHGPETINHDDDNDNESRINFQEPMTKLQAANSCYI